MKNNLQTAQAYFEVEADKDFAQLYAQVDAHIEALEATSPSQTLPGGTRRRTANRRSPQVRADSIFDDVDD
ncbi:MAG: hypothetical protein JY451_11090 [Erythrobacter sp.]|nr:MAG: hypothetical protein JY451_11090 [Erythrobacter sp.]